MRLTISFGQPHKISDFFRYEEADSDLKLAESAFRDRKSCGPMRNKNYWQAELLAIRSKWATPYFREIKRLSDRLTG